MNQARVLALLQARQNAIIQNRRAKIDEHNRRVREQKLANAAVASHVAPVRVEINDRAHSMTYTKIHIKPTEYKALSLAEQFKELEKRNELKKIQSVLDHVIA
jgi:hypothetical protein